MDLNTLWIGDSLPILQRLCLASAVATGCRTRLFTYEPVDGVPPGVEVVNGNEVLGLDKMVRHRQSQSVAVFSDRFRYELLGKGFGAWIDADLLFLKAPEANSDVLAGWEDRKLVSSSFIWIRPGHPLIDDLRRHAFDEYPIPGWYPFWKRAYLAYRKAKGRPEHVSDLQWGVIGPDLFTWLLRQHRMLSAVRRKSWCCGLPSRWRHMIGDGNYDWRQWIDDDTVCVHLWNHVLWPEERWRRPEPGSLLSTVAERCDFQWPAESSPATAIS